MLEHTNPRTLRLLDFAEFLEGLPDERINLTIWACGTQACYAGHAILRYGTSEEIDSLYHRGRYATVSPRIIASDILGLSVDERTSRLFHGGYFYPTLSKKEAVELLRKWAFEVPVETR